MERRVKVEDIISSIKRNPSGWEKLMGEVVSSDLPKTPEGYPNSWAQVLRDEFRDPCAIPLRSDKGWVWVPCLDCKFVLHGGKLSNKSKFETFEEALAIAKGVQEYIKNRWVENK